MATFTDEEYADSARIVRGYDRFKKTTLPYMLNPNFADLAHVLGIRDAFLGSPVREPLFKIIDGVQDVVRDDFDQTHNAPQYFSELLHLDFRTQKISTEDIIKTLIARESDGTGRPALMYITSADDKTVSFVLGVKDGNIHIAFLDIETVSFGDSRPWRLKEKPLVDPQQQAPHSISFTTFVDVETYLKTMGTTCSNASAEPGKKEWEMSFSLDQGQFDDKRLNNEAMSARDETLSSHEAKNMCLMMTENWVEPNFEHDSNLPPLDVLNELVGDDRFEAGYCVEQSSALAINNLGGINGTFTKPRFRFLPSRAALQSENPQINLSSLDPFTTDTLSVRLFGTRQKEAGHFLDSYEIGEQGACIRISGHQYFAKKAGDSIDVYDTAIRFCGNRSLYEAYLSARGMTRSIHDISPVTGLNTDRRDFFRRCKTAYTDPRVQAETKALFAAHATDQRTLTNLYRSWNKAMCSIPDAIAGAMSMEASIVQSAGTTGADADILVKPEEINSMLNSQERCFIGVEIVSETSGNIGSAVIFKDGSRYFVSRGSRDNDFEEDIALDTTGKPPGISFSVQSFGGNDVTRMREIFTAGIGQARTAPIASGEVAR